MPRKRNSQRPYARVEDLTENLTPEQRKKIRAVKRYKIVDGIEVPVTPRRRSSGSGKKSKKKKQGTLSKEWRQLRKEHLMVYPECRVCGSTQRQVVHHLRYRPGGYGNSERPGDLVTLCEFHHNDFHKRLGRSGTGVQETIQYIKRESVAFEVDEMADSMFGHKF